MRAFFHFSSPLSIPSIKSDDGLNVITATFALPLGTVLEGTVKKLVCNWIKIRRWKLALIVPLCVCMLRIMDDLSVQLRLKIYTINKTSYFLYTKKAYCIYCMFFIRSKQ